MAKAASRRVKKVTRETYRNGFSAFFPLPVVATTTMQVSERQRARIRRTIRTSARTVWKTTPGTFPVTHYVALVVTNYETPSAIAESVKPIIDAGTDCHLWPDDDAYHRKSTIYVHSVDEANGGVWVRLIILPVPESFQIGRGLSRLTSRLTGADGLTVSFAIPPHLWVTSNLTDADIAARQTGAHHAQPGQWGNPKNWGMRENILHQLASQAHHTWEKQPTPEHNIVLAGVAYAPSVVKTQADPDNSAETVTTLLTAGNISPRLLAYYRYPVDETTAGYHRIHLSVLPIPDSFNIFYALLACTQNAWHEQEKHVGKKI